MGKKKNLTEVLVDGLMDLDLPYEKIYTGIKYKIDVDYPAGKAGKILDCQQKYKGKKLPLTIRVHGLPGDMSGVACVKYVTKPNSLTGLEITLDLQTGYLYGGTDACWKPDGK